MRKYTDKMLVQNSNHYFSTDKNLINVSLLTILLPPEKSFECSNLLSTVA